MKWIKDIDRLPLNANLVHINYNTGSTDFKTTGYYEDGCWHYRNGDILQFHPNLEWLDETESPSLSSAEEAIGFAEWMVKFGYKHSHNDAKEMPVYYHKLDEHKPFDKVNYYYLPELFNLYKQSKK